MSNFKVGDIVILQNYERVTGCDSKIGNEAENWAEIAKLPLNIPLVVESLSVRGWLYLKGYKYCHHPYKFTLKTDNTMSKQLTGYKLKKAIPGDSRTVGTVVPMTTEEGYYSLMPDFWEPQYKEEEEIEIASYKAELRRGSVIFGCQTFSTEELLAIGRLWTIDPTVSFNIVGTPITRELVNKILSKI